MFGTADDDTEPEALSPSDNYRTLLDQSKQSRFSVPIGDSGLNLAIYHNGDTGVHDDDGQPVHPVKVMEAVDRLRTGHADADAAANTRPVLDHGGGQVRTVAASNGAKPGQLTRDWFIDKAPTVSNPRTLVPGAKYTNVAGGYLMATFPDHSTAYRSPQGQWMTSTEWALHAGRLTPSSDPLPDGAPGSNTWRSGTGGATVNRGDQFIHTPNKLAPSKPNLSPPLALGVEWGLGMNPSNSHPVHPGSNIPDVTFHSGDPMTEQLRKMPEIQQQLHGISAGLSSGKLKVGKPVNFTVSLGHAGLRRVAHDAQNIVTNGATGNLTSTFLGSYNGKYQVVGVDPKKRIATVRMHATNTTGLESATRIPKQGYNNPHNTVQDNVEHPRRIFNGKPITGGLNDRSHGAMKNQRQDFEWYEAVPY